MFPVLQGWGGKIGKRRLSGRQSNTEFLFLLLFSIPVFSLLKGLVVVDCIRDSLIALDELEFGH